MENIEYDLKAEYEDVIKQVSEKFNYSEDLKALLEKIVPTMIDGKSFEQRQLFFKMLLSTPIFVIDEKDPITTKEFTEQYVGDANKYVKYKDAQEDEYERKEPAASYVTEPIFDENLNIVDVKKFIFVRAFDTKGSLSETRQKFVELFGTGIAASHLIHELGHAWAAQEKPYSVEDGKLTERIGTADFIYKINSLGNSKYEIERESKRGLMLEEGLNSVSEEDALMRMLDLDIEGLRRIYKEGIIIPSQYQSIISRLVRHMKEGGFSKELDDWRIFGNVRSKERLNQIYGETNFYQKRKQIYERVENVGEKTEGESIVKQRNRIIKKILSGKHGDEIREFEGDLFPQTEDMTPMDTLDSILIECFDIDAHKYKIPLEDYTEMIKVLIREGYGYVEQGKKVLEVEREGNKGQK